MQVFEDEAELTVDVIVVSVILKIVVYQESLDKWKVGWFCSDNVFLLYYYIQFIVENFETKQTVRCGGKKIIMNKQAVKIIKPIFIENSGVGFDNVCIVKPVNLLFSTLAYKITF